MTLRLNPYLSFRDNAREAMEFYQSISGGELNVVSFSDAQMDEEMPSGGTMHAMLTTPDFVLMASDAMPRAEETWGGTRNYISLGSTDKELLTGWFEKLSEGGNVGVPLAPQQWGAVFGLCMDRYGIEWMVNIYQG